MEKIEDKRCCKECKFFIKSKFNKEFGYCNNTNVKNFIMKSTEKCNYYLKK